MFKTLFGNNFIGIGLIVSYIAIIIGMIPFSNSADLSICIYLFGTFLMAIGLIVEFKSKQNDYLSHWYFYSALLFVALPVAGPVISLWILYMSHQETKHRQFGNCSVLLSTIKIFLAMFLAWVIFLIVYFVILGK
ncbi:MAG: hypothetical protein R3331_01775 [Sulfurospirillaceae bacterium]|nr:hypothetical protein [Sulfurospirillaceae bacterium]